MQLHLPTIPDSLRRLDWRVRGPVLSDLPGRPSETLQHWSGAEPARATTTQGWTAWWTFGDGRICMIYDLGVFVAIARVSNVDAPCATAVVDVLLGAHVDLSSDEPVALVELTR